MRLLRRRCAHRKISCGWEDECAEETAEESDERRGKKREERMDRENERARVPLVMSFGGRSEFGYLIRERERTGSNETIV